MGQGPLARSKKNAGLKGTILFVDESGFSERPPLRRTWSPRGETPVVTLRGRSWRRVSAIGALAYRVDGSRARVFVCLHDTTVRTAEIARFLRHLRRHVRGRVILVWDGLSAHRSPTVQKRLARFRWEAERLPAYAPELNPVEGLWSCTKAKALANRGGEDLSQLKAGFRRGIRRVRRIQPLLHGLLAKAGLFL